jgi:hypothetical protein
MGECLRGNPGATRDTRHAAGWSEEASTTPGPWRVPGEDVSA